ncbi:hypothetical protein BCR33DRAFT_219367 [Rhizoclosmatium globosum]|uniref:Uncharacterized protein n=1 Tax=Rhizoclosmatium globosum TaxID=329046 RepID=A0A1Y2CBC0_9FUNG|nr:hypothetical protein BCR33DRAFT_219367 [Rhizoclosmatium globosum]|eukprot:ORY44332.1 hypothetical protein BCR33DRAFT_219367 [Rhizoclosmatium globosum]
MLSSQLAKDYNLSLVRLGEAKLQSEALVAKCLEFFQAQQEQSKHITRLEQQLYDLMSLQQEKEEGAGIIHIFQKQQETKEVDLLRSQVESLTKETAEQAERIRLLSIESNFAKRALIDTRETHAAELQVLLDENTAHQNDFNTLINEHSDLTAQHSELQSSHSDLKEFSTDMVQRHESAQKEIENRKFYYEGVIEKLKTDLETTTTERDAALQKMVEAQTQTAYYYQTWVEMDANVQSLNQH